MYENYIDEMIQTRRQIHKRPACGWCAGNLKNSVFRM